MALIKNDYWPFNNPQSEVILQKPREVKAIWSRGTGKSFLIAWLIHLIVKNMPRSSWAIIGKSYKQILTRTLPSTIFALEHFFGYKEGRDFFVRKKPPKSLKFDTPLYKPHDYDHGIVFPNGCFFHLVSLDGGGSTIRGLNIDGYLGDEALEINKEKMDPAVVPTNRGQLRYYGHIPWHHGNFFFSSMGYGNDFKWMLDAGQYYLDDGFDYRSIRQQIVEAALNLVDSNDPEKMAELWRVIVDLKKQLKWYKSPEGVLYIEADIFDNIEVVGWQYLKQQRRALPDFVFLVEILNWFPEQIDGGFYADLSRLHHGYSNKFDTGYIGNLELEADELKTPDCRMDADLVPGQPLRVSVDWGKNFNCLTVSQYLTSINTLRYLKNIYVKDDILDLMAEAMDLYYEPHDKKEIYLSYGHDGNIVHANSKLTYAKQFAKILRGKGWVVHLNPKAVPLSQMERYLLWSKVLKNTIAGKKGQAVDPKLPLVEFNLDNCHETFVSMQNAGLKEGIKGLEKDKKNERNASFPQEDATHLSDAADYELCAVVDNPFVTLPGYIGY